MPGIPARTATISRGIEPRANLHAGFALLLIASPAAWADSQGNANKFMDMSLEELMNVPVSSVSKFPQKRSDAPAAVTVVTAQDIKDFGYRTLADVLRSVRGLFVDYDRIYHYLGINGFGRQSGDYNGKFLLLIDGSRINEVVYDQASLGTDFILDPELIERVEFVPGASSSVYGSNALFGVINVITKSAADLDGLTLSGQVASFGTDKERLSVAKHFENGLDAIFSGSHYASNGQNLFFPEFNDPATNNGVAKGMDQDVADRLFGKLRFGQFNLEAGYVARKKFVPTAPFDTTFNQKPNFDQDQQLFADLSYSNVIAEKLSLDAHAYYGQYQFIADYPYTDTKPASINRDTTRSQWSGLEVRLLDTHFADHKLIVGGEYQNNFRQDQLNFDTTAPFTTYTRAIRTGYRFGFYGQDEYALRDDLIVNLGLRYDYYSTFGDTLNPRVGLIYHPWEETAIKLLYGTAFRAPTAYELFYSSPQFKANPNLGPEKIRTYEIIAEHQANSNLRLTATAYRYDISDLITQVTDPSDNQLTFRNVSDVNGWGADLEVDQRWDNGIRARLSYSWSRLRDGASGARLQNSPTHVAKLNVSAPVWNDWFRVGVDAQYVGERLGKSGQAVAGFPVLNLTVTTDSIFQKTFLHGLEISGSIYNLFNQNYAAVAGEEVRLNSIRQDGLNLRLILTYHY